MIKSLSGEDEITKKDGAKSDSEERGSETKSVDDPVLADSPDGETRDKVESDVKSDVPQTVKPFEIVEPIGKPKVDKRKSTAENSGSTDEAANQLELVVSNKPEPDTVEPTSSEKEMRVPDSAEAKPLTEKDEGIETEADGKVSVSRKAFTPETPSETIRKSGLAWSAAIILFGSVTFMTVLGWFADFRFETQPWGIVVGLILGAVIGFIQFFRTTAQILSPPKPEIKNNPIFSNQNEDKFD